MKRPKNKNLTFRVRDDMHERLAKGAAERSRSISEEIEDRLEASFASEVHMSELEHEIRGLQKALRDDRVTIGRLTQLLEARGTAAPSGTSADDNRQDAFNTRFMSVMRYMNARIHRLEQTLNISGNFTPEGWQKTAEGGSTPNKRESAG
jgi:hypothetical protein